MQDKKIKIGIVDDHPMTSQGLKMILLQDTRFEITGIFTTGRQILDYIKSNQLDIVFLDVGLPDGSGIEICKEIKKENTKTLVVIITNRSERSLILQSIQNGASGYLLKNTGVEEISECIQNVILGNIVYSDEVKKIISNPSLLDLQGIPRLTKREIEIIKMIAEGKTSQEIAEILVLSSLTITAHRRNILQKFNAKNTTEMINLAKEYNLIA